MTRKDSEKDAERPHYYSQFWLDIAAGRRVIGGPKPEEGENNEVEAPEPAPVAARKSSRAEAPRETRASAIVEPDIDEDEGLEAVGESDLPNILLDDESENEEEPLDEDEDDEEFFDEEEEEDDEEWGRRGTRKKAKPARPVKPVKKPKRDTRRGF